MNWISASENGRWSQTTQGISGGITVFLGFSMVVFFGLMTTSLGQVVNTDETVDTVVLSIVDSLSALGVGLFYMVITSLFLTAWWLESREGNTKYVSVVDLGPLSTWVVGIVLGVVCGILFIFGMSQAIGSFFAFETLTIFGVNIEPIILVLAPVVAIPIAEELFFGGLFTPTLAEAMGVIPAALIIGLIWVLWHIGTYATATEVLVFLFLFRIVMTFVILHYKSLMPAIVAHIVINFAGTFFVF